ncbi:MAG: hypothetical protein IT324_06830 [Anaerolineae bacterium]|nr:hypothetical protein [Anaerolineae bacterium]
MKTATGLGQLLAPTWNLVGGYKHWHGYTPLTDQQYTTLYLDLLRTRYRANEQAFIDLIQCPTLVLLCYCQAGVFCHRHLAVDVLGKIATAKGLPLTRGCELSTSSNF